VEDSKIFAKMEREGEIMGRARHHWNKELDWTEARGEKWRMRTAAQHEERSCKRTYANELL
jgi:hypothetical protein